MVTAGILFWSCPQLGLGAGKWVAAVEFISKREERRGRSWWPRGRSWWSRWGWLRTRPWSIRKSWGWPLLVLLLASLGYDDGFALCWKEQTWSDVTFCLFWTSCEKWGVMQPVWTSRRLNCSPLVEDRTALAKVQSSIFQLSSPFPLFNVATNLLPPGWH